MRCRTRSRVTESSAAHPRRARHDKRPGMTSDTVSAAITAHLETARESKAPKLLGDCVSELATVLLASHPRAIALRAISGDEKNDTSPASGFGVAVTKPQLRLTGPSARRASISSPSARETSTAGI